MKKKCKDVYVSALDLRDEIDVVKGLIRSINLLVTQGDHKLYTPDPIYDLFIVLDQRLDHVEDGLKGLVKE